MASPSERSRGEACEQVGVPEGGQQKFLRRYRTDLKPLLVKGRAEKAKVNLMGIKCLQAGVPCSPLG